MSEPIGNSEQLPVAWMETYCGEPNNLAWSKEDFETIHPYNVVPLYAHPPTEQSSLTDKQIIDFIFKFFNLDVDTELSDDFWVKYEDLIDFAKELNGVKKK